LRILQIARHAHAEVDAVLGWAQPLTADDPLHLDLHVAHAAGVQREDPCERAHARELARARGHGHVRGELIGGKAHAVEHEYAVPGARHRRRQRASRQAGTDNDHVDLLHLLPSFPTAASLTDTRASRKSRM